MNISCKNNSSKELTIETLLKKILENFPSKYIFTNDVTIEEGSISHSHPILTLSTRDCYLENPDILLSTFVHEQIHWFLSNKDISTYIKKLEKIYPNVPIGGTNGAKSRYSSYLHIIVGYLEIFVLKELIGRSRSNAVLTFLKNDHYTKIYEIIDNDFGKLENIFKSLILIIQFTD